MIFFTAPFLLPQKFTGRALWPFILLREKALKEDLVLINHEKIHLRQQLEMLVLPFYIWYGAEYFFRLIQYKQHHLAYRNISFEREAYGNEKGLDYVSKRKIFAFVKYL